ncbi:MAG: hypothetical protein PHV71_01525 [Eubacteriales bacterium]|nr:hypothetical protein [Eubacteriales bacterium]MDD3198835.1 hypothetical protein [Eubacteriales bacterium]MDD4629266.1 hypothetical protein [Eubacteriales bacterium]
MKIKIKTGMFHTELCEIEAIDNSIIISGDGFKSIELDKSAVWEIYMRLSGLKSPVFEIRTESGEIEGILADSADAEEFMLFLKREFGRKAIID